MQTLRETTIQRARELRKQRGMTQQQLADVLNRLGAQVDRTAIAKVEAGARELALVEVFQYAQALHVAPVHLLVPTDSTEPISIGPNLEATPAEIRAWVRGQMPLFQDPRLYFSTVPASEFAAADSMRAAWQQQAPIDVRTNDEQQEEA